MSYAPVSCFLVVMAVDDSSSLDEADVILKYLTEDGLCKEKAVILVANKADLVRSRVVTVECEHTLKTKIILFVQLQQGNLWPEDTWSSILRPLQVGSVLGKFISYSR